MLPKYVIKKMVEPFRVPTQYLHECCERQRFNEVLGEYFRKYGHETGDAFKYLTLKQRVEECHSVFFFNEYEDLNIRDLHSVNLCKSPFCKNCQKIIQANRVMRYAPILNSFLDNGLSLYHVVFTVLNCSGSELSNTIDKLFNMFSKLIRYFDGRVKVKGIDFSKFGFKGALRSLECTIKGDDEYHPHLHCIFAFNNEVFLDGDRYIINKFSYDRNGNIKRIFTEFEEFLQKFSYCVVNCKKVTLDEFNKIDLGYDCSADLCYYNYYEVFKYAFKIDLTNFSYNNFKTIYEAFYNRRLIQGYGNMYSISDKIDVDIDDSFVKGYMKTKKYLDEYPRKIGSIKPYQLPRELIENKNTYISGKKIVQNVLNIKDFDEDLKNSCYNDLFIYDNNFLRGEENEF